MPLLDAQKRISTSDGLRWPTPMNTARVSHRSSGAAVSNLWTVRRHSWV